MPENNHSNGNDAESVNAASANGVAAFWFRVALWKRTLLGLAIGCLLGVTWPGAAEYAQPVGELFLRAIKMLVAPLVFSTIVAGIVSMGDVSKLGSIGIKVLVFYLVTTAIAILIGFGAALLLPSFAAIDVQSDSVQPPAALESSFADRIVEMVPTNPFEALSNGDVFQIIVFAILTGIGILLSGKSGRALADVIASFAEVMLKITELIMELAPLGVLALMLVTVGTYGVETLASLVSLIVIFYAACLFHMFVTYGGILRVYLRLGPMHFFQGVADAQVVAFSTTSSSATLPATLTCVQENLGVDRSTSSFVLPLGATINMDGTGIYLGVMTVFAAQMGGISLSFVDCVELVVAATLASIGIAGVPGGSLVMLSTVLLALDLPLEIFALVAGVDRILDMARTTVNVTGDALASVYVSKKLGDFDLNVYNAAAEK